jgi:hypothetical protein
MVGLEYFWLVAGYVNIVRNVKHTPSSFDPMARPGRWLFRSDRGNRICHRSTDRLITDGNGHHESDQDETDQIGCEADIRVVNKVGQPLIQEVMGYGYCEDGTQQR